MRNVKVKNLPDLDDDFAQTASEWNTVGELRSNTRKQMEAMRRAGQVGQARDRAIEALIEQVDLPLPQAIIDHEVAHRHESLSEDLDRAGLTMEQFLESRDLNPADLDREIAEDVRRSVKARFLLDKLAETEELDLTQEDLADYLTQLAYQQGVSPDALASQLADSGQLAAVASDVIRSKAADVLARRVRVTDQSGRNIEVGTPATAEGDEEEPDGADETDEAAQKGRASRRGAGRRAAKDDSAPAKPKGRARRGAKDAGDPAKEDAEPAEDDAGPAEDAGETEAE